MWQVSQSVVNVSKNYVNCPNLSYATAFIKFLCEQYMDTCISGFLYIRIILIRTNHKQYNMF